MPFSVINVGAAPNDGTGATLRNAFIAVNANWALMSSTALAAGASLVGVHDAAGNYIGADVETVLAEIAGDLTPASIKAAYEGNLDTNAFTDAQSSKLGGVETNAKDDQTGGEIAALYEALANKNAFTDALLAKLNSIDATHYGPPLETTVELSALQEANVTDKERRYVEDELSDYFYDATALSGDIAPDDQTGGTGFWRKVVASGETAASIKTKYESNADTNAFTDAFQTKLTQIEALADVTDQGNVLAALVTSGAGVPVSTPTAEGLVYVDTTNDTYYGSVGTVSSSDWKLLTEPLNILHTNVADEFSGITQKVSPTGADRFFGEDQAAGGAKIWSTLADMLTGIGTSLADQYDTNKKTTYAAGDVINCSDADNANVNLQDFGMDPDDHQAALIDRTVQTAVAYTLALTDRGDIVERDNAAANTCTIPLNASVAFPVDRSMINIVQIGAGITTIDGATGVTLNGVLNGSVAINAQWEAVSIYKVATDEWRIQGALAAPVA